METKYEIANPNPVLSEYQPVFFFTAEDLARLQQIARNPIADFEPYHIAPLRAIWLACQPQALALTAHNRLQLSAQLVQYLLQISHARIYLHHQANAAALATINGMQQKHESSVILKRQAELAKQKAELMQRLVLLEPLVAACSNNTPIPADATMQLTQSLNWLVANHYYKLENHEHLGLLKIIGLLLGQPVAQHVDYVKKLENSATSMQYLLTNDESEQAKKVNVLLAEVLEYCTNYLQSFIAPPLPNFATLSSALAELTQVNSANSKKLQELQNTIKTSPAIAMLPADQTATAILAIFNKLTETRVAEVATDRNRTAFYIFENFPEEKKTSDVPAPSVPVYISRLQPTHLTRLDAVKYKSDLIIVDPIDILQENVAGIVLSPLVKQLLEKVLFQSDWQASTLYFFENALSKPNAIPMSFAGLKYYTNQRNIHLVVNATTKQVEWVIAELQRVSTDLTHSKPEFGLFAALQITEQVQQDQTKDYAPGTFPPLPFYYSLCCKPKHWPYFQYILQSMLNKPAATGPSSFFAPNSVPILGMASLGALLCTGACLALYFFLPALTLNTVLPPVGMALVLIGISILIAFAGAVLFGAITGLILELKNPPQPVIPSLTPVPIDLTLTPEAKQLQNWLMSVCFAMHRPGAYGNQVQPTQPLEASGNIPSTTIKSSSSTILTLEPEPSTSSASSISSGTDSVNVDSDMIFEVTVQHPKAFDSFLLDQGRAESPEPLAQQQSNGEFTPSVALPVAAK